MIYASVLMYIILLAISALCSGTENAYSSVNPHLIERLATSPSAKKKDKLVFKIWKNFNYYLSTILLLNNLVNLAISSVSVGLVSTLFNEKYAFVGTFVSTLLIIIFSEITPKLYAHRNSATWTKRTASILRFIHILLLPLTFPFDKLTDKIKMHKSKAEDTQIEDLEVAFEKIENDGLIEQREAELLQNTIEFQDTAAFEIAVPRIDIDGLDVEDSKNVITEIVSGTRFSRLLVYKGSRDNPLGVIFTKNVLKFLINNPNSDEEDVTHFLQENMMDLLFVYKTMPLASVYNKMKKSNIHMAIVCDEFGSTYGIITMEDILEELVGEIWDESDTIKPDMKKIGLKTWKIRGELSIDDFLARTETERENYEVLSDTVGGLAWEMLGDKLKKYDRFEFNGYMFEVRRIEKRRVVFLNATRIN